MPTRSWEVCYGTIMLSRLVALVPSHERNVEDFPLCLKAVDFGKGDLWESERIFYQRFNNEMVSLCRSLPRSTQTDSMLFVMRYAGVQLGDEPHFFANYYGLICFVQFQLRRNT